MTTHTPCEALGYKVGQKFRVTGDNTYFSVGSIVHLIVDDGSEIPKFASDPITDFTEAYMMLRDVEPLDLDESIPGLTPWLLRLIPDGNDFEDYQDIRVIGTYTEALRAARQMLMKEPYNRDPEVVILQAITRVRYDEAPIIEEDLRDE